MGDLADNGHHRRPLRPDVGPPNMDPFTEKRVFSNMNVHMPACDKGIAVNDRYGVMDVNVPVGDPRDVDVRDIYPRDVHTVGTIIPVAIIDLSRSQRDP